MAKDTILAVGIENVYAHARRYSMGFIDSRFSGEQLVDSASRSVFHSIPPPRWDQDEYYVGIEEDRELYHIVLQELGVLLRAATQQALDTFKDPATPHHVNIVDGVLLILIQGE